MIKTMYRSKYESYLLEKKRILEEIEKLRLPQLLEVDNSKDERHDGFHALSDRELKANRLLSMLDDITDILIGTEVIEDVVIKDAVKIGDVVKVELIINGGDVLEQSFLIVPSLSNIDSIIKELSMESPLGKEIIGKKLGETGIYKAGMGTINFLVMEINGKTLEKGIER